MQSGHENQGPDAIERLAKRAAATCDAENPETMRPPEKADANQKNVRPRKRDRFVWPEIPLLLPDPTQT
jgi:hypothetical protein